MKLLIPIIAYKRSVMYKTLDLPLKEGKYQDNFIVIKCKVPFPSSILAFKDVNDDSMSFEMTRLEQCHI